MSMMTSKGQVTIPKTIRDALQLVPGSEVHFDVAPDGAVLIRSQRRAPQKRASNRFAAALGKADIPWRTDDLMRLLRGNR